MKRDFLALYKQTILGPLWHVVHPVVSALIFSVIFGQIAKIPTDGVPPLLFYMSGLLGWNYFVACLQKTSDTFVSNSGIFGKVYFPRLVMPISVILISLVTFAIQGCVLLVLIGFFSWRGFATHLSPWALIAVPLLVLQMAALGLGLGILISALTTRYRDLAFLMGFGVQLWMYATPIVYPLSQVPPHLYPLVAANPMTPIIETMRYMLLGSGTLNTTTLLVSIAETAAILFLGLIVFVRVEKTVMDHV
ncbi:MAG: ABC transporter permease [Glaciimonas sp.]|nr:ABC transporter permease [Glaciimonas sp.]